MSDNQNLRFQCDRQEPLNDEELKLECLKLAMIESVIRKGEVLDTCDSALVYYSFIKGATPKFLKNDQSGYTPPTQPV